MKSGVSVLSLSMKKITFTPEQTEEMISLYQSGLAIATISDKLNLDKGVVERHIKANTNTRTLSEATRLRKGIKYVRSDAFDILTPESLYWIGFLYADGFIQKSGPVLGVGLAEVDRSHLEKFNQFLGGCLNIITITQKNNGSLRGYIAKETTYCRIKVADRRLYERLLHFGFTNAKSNHIIPHDLLKGSRDFWRGVVDGDGWLCFVKDKKYPDQIRVSIGLSGTEATLIEFVKFIQLNGIEINYMPRKRTRSNVWQLDIHSEVGKDVTNLLYKDSKVYLDRKYNKYLEFNQ